MHNEDLTAVGMQWQGKARQGKCRVSVEMKQITEICDRENLNRKSIFTKNAVYDGVKSQFCKICKTNNTVAWSTFFRIF
ncbi:hypothetical protein T4E_1728 [Trichinella pseudospiralis]|uniref:Uncharacterized protein n=1 Tax=Trichinella pseudospiralis TaxID=6337 RepID=A0A0V0YPE4_TRIPS|nr:hypothetical protein T4E_1728 [Trichinella pseudospiralis]